MAFRCFRFGVVEHGAILQHETTICGTLIQQMLNVFLNLSDRT
jgi:hypothetical protein